MLSVFFLLLFFNNSCYRIPPPPTRIMSIRVKGGTPKIIQTTISYHAQQCL